jgi:hypothetical protein
MDVEVQQDSFDLREVGVVFLDFPSASFTKLQVLGTNPRWPGDVIHFTCEGDIACPSARSLVEGARTMLDARNSEQNLSAMEEAEANPAGQTMPQVWMPFLLSWKIWLLQSMDFKET